jgi:hypothetical protein
LKTTIKSFQMETLRSEYHLANGDMVVEQTITGIEASHMIRKKLVEIMPAISDVQGLNKLFGLPA